MSAVDLHGPIADADGVWLGEQQDEPTTDLRTGLESRAETSSLEELQTRRRLIIERNARLFALYGNFGHYDDHRKRMVEAHKIKARLELSAGREKKPTETEIDAAAYGSEGYGKFIDEALAEKIEYLKLSTELSEVEESIRSRELEITAYGREITLR